MRGEARVYTPEAIGALMLGRMKDIAEQFFKRKVTRAVLAVPGARTDQHSLHTLPSSYLPHSYCHTVEFDEQQRAATKAAAASVGLKTLAVVRATRP